MNQLVGQFKRALPNILAWIDRCIETHRHAARSVADLGFNRFAQHFTPALLRGAKVVEVDRVEQPPLAQLGLPGFAAFEAMQSAGITLRDTFFVAPHVRSIQHVHFHELVHVVQWSELGAEDFLMLYGIGLAQYGYRNSPLEQMAYSLEEVFKRGGPALGDVEGAVRQKTRALWNTAASILGASG